MLHGRKIDDFVIITIDSTTADNHESTFVIGTNDLENDTGAHTNLYSSQVEGAFGWFGNSIDSGNITAIICYSNCDHNHVLMMNYFLIVTKSPVLRINYFLIVTVRRVLIMKLILNMTLKRKFMMKLVLIGTLVCLRMNLSD